MADRVRINMAEKNAAVNDLRAKADDAMNYINSQLQSSINSFSSWWEGDAYNAFKQDFEVTKNKFRKEIYDEIRIYADNLNKAVESQKEQDTSNSNTIKTN